MPVSKKILLDTNFLLIPGQFGVDIFSEIEKICPFKHKLYIVDSTLTELEKIVREQRGKDKEAAKLAISLLQPGNIEKIGTGGKYADAAILGLSDRDTIVATQDKELKEKLKEKKIPLITLRQKKYLVIQGI